MRIFISYSSRDRDRVARLAQNLETMGFEVWYDPDITGGQKWWNTILDAIYDCDLFVFALTPKSLASLPCQLEFKYAYALNKRILPVRLTSEVNPAHLPPELQAIQYEDYFRGTQTEDRKLMRAIQKLPAAMPMPDPLPEPPPVPISPLGELREKIAARSMGVEMQTYLVHELKQFLDKPSSRAEAVKLLQTLQTRTDVLKSVSDDISTIIKPYVRRKVEMPPRKTTSAKPSRRLMAGGLVGLVAIVIVVVVALLLGGGGDEGDQQNQSGGEGRTEVAQNLTDTPTSTPSPTGKPSATITASPSPTDIFTQQLSDTPTTTTATHTNTLTSTPSPTDTLSPTPSATPSPTDTPTKQPSERPTPTATDTLSPMPSVTNTHTATASSTPTVYVTPLRTPSANPLATFVPVGINRSGGEINVRSGPTTESEVIEILQLGESVVIKGQNPEGTWYQVQLPNDKVGWIRADLLTEAEEVTRNNEWIPATQTFDGVTMVLVPAGCFDMGSTNGGSDEQPVERQCFDAPFWIDKYEVTNAQFEQLDGQAALDSNWTEPDRPRERITWIEARDFCAERDARLPTEKEWEYAARGPDNLVYPWGVVFEPDNVVYYGNSDSHTWPVGSKIGGRSWVGAYDLSGNVWEWVSTIYDQYPYDGGDGREDINNTNSSRVLRGGSWYNNVDLVRSANRLRGASVDWDHGIGFRCARSS